MVIGNRCGNIRAPDAASWFLGQAREREVGSQRAVNSHYGHSVAPVLLINCRDALLSIYPLRP